MLKLGTTLLSVALISFLFVFSCTKKEFENPIADMDWMVLADEYTIKTQEELTITPTFSSAEVDDYNFVWTIFDEDVVKLVRNNNTSITVEAIKPGCARIKVECYSESQRFSDYASIIVEQSPLRILAIGNSFSQDAVEQYLWNLLNAANIEAIIANMYIGGCSLEKHWSNAQNNNDSYEYRKIIEGVKINKMGTSLSKAIKDEKWDYISLQQVSGLSGQYETYKPFLQNMIDYVSSLSTNKYMKMMFHQTWAYSNDSIHSDFPKYDNNQIVMYNAIVAAVNQAVEEHNIDIMIPAGTAIQNGRTSKLGDTFNRDGYHLETTYGRYTVACTWFEILTGQSVVGNNFVPATLDAEIATIAQNAAHRAVLKPSEVTMIDDFALETPSL